MKLNSIRGKELLKKIASILAAVVLVALIIAVCIFFYLQRYVVYTENGTKMDVDSYPVNSAMASKTPVVPKIEATVVYDEALPPEEEVVDPSDLPVLETLDAVYVTYDQMQDIPTLEASLSGLEYTSMVVSVKRDHGSVVFPSSAASGYTEGDTAAVAAFLEKQADKGIYLVAKLVCFRDDLFALDNQSQGLPITGGALWLDDDSYYWMSPTSEAALSYIVSLGRELKILGFSEILLDKFQYPVSGSTSSIVYSDLGSKTDNITASATTVCSGLAAAGLRTSLLCSASACKNGGDNEAGWDMSRLTNVFDRIYVSLDAGSDVKSVCEGLDTASGKKILMKNWLVFITASNDTRFADYGKARPVD